MDTLRKQEHGVYAAVWTLILILAPLILIDYGRLSGGMSVWKEILDLWRRLIPFLTASLLHHFLLLPLLPKKRGVYLLCALALTAAIGIQQFISPHCPGPPHPPSRESVSPFPPSREPVSPGLPPTDSPMPGMSPGDRPAPPETRPVPHENRRPIEPELIFIVLTVLMFGVDIGLRLFFDRLRSERRMRTLQNENLKNQLAALRYQINPHFFMNTLNNIHALVDIDPEQAKLCIEEFSKLMRIVLYDSREQTIPLDKELDFLSHYLSLMRLRFTEKVTIESDFPATGTDAARVPPIILGSFLENAFKYGISYQESSWIRCRLALTGDRMVFCCENSVHADMQIRQEGGGLGLDNVRKRLDLLYPGRYTLDIRLDERQYGIRLEIPVQPALNA